MAKEKFERSKPHGIRDSEPALRAHSFSGARRLHQEHDHRGGADGRGHSGDGHGLDKEIS